jgi:hypothetical protein
MSTPALNPLVDKIRALHPGAYDDMDDAMLTKKVLAKYPQYSDLAAPAVPAPPNPMTGANKEFLLGGPELGTSPGDTATDAAAQAATGMFQGTFGNKGPNAVNLGIQMYRKATGRPFDLTSPIQNAALMMAPEDELGSLREATSTAPRPFLLKSEGPGMVSRVGKVLLNKVPGVKFATDVLDALRGPEPPPAPVAKPPGLTIPTQPPAPMPAAEAPRPFTPEPSQSNNAAQLSKKLDDLLRDAVGNKPVQPGVSIGEQTRPFAAAPVKPAIPEGHTPVESTAVTSFKYDPQANELHIHANGKTYTYGDISREDAATFQNAQSKGKAWQAIKANNPLVKKNGVPVKPTEPRSF